MTPESVGRTSSKLVLGKHSGRHAFVNKLGELGYKLGDNALEDAFNRFKALSDRKKEIYDDDIIALVDDEVIRRNESIKVVSLQVRAGSEGPQVADLVLDIDGTPQKTTTEGNGPVDATFTAIRQLVPHEEAVLDLYQVHAVTKGTDAQAEVTVKLSQGESTVIGQGADVDVLVASCRAYVHALNMLLTKTDKEAIGPNP